MLDCLIIGDSIAQGVSQFEKQCISYTEVGISPKKFNYKFSNKYPKNKATTVISLGSNNPGSKETMITDLSKTRNKLKSQKIIWILPHNNRLKGIVREVAEHFGDEYIEFEVSSDNIHPKSYKKLDNNLRKL